MTGLAAVLLLAGVAIALLSLIVVHLLPTGLNPVRDPVSQYGITSYRGWYWSAAGGAAVAGIGGVLFFAPTGGVISTVTIVLLAVFAVARAAIGFFPMDAPGSGRTGTGRTHNLLATAAFASVTAAAFTGAGALHDAGFPDASAWSTACGVVMAVGAIGVLITARRERLGLFGLTERIIYLGFLAWFVLLGVLALS
ncbi:MULTISPECIES: DUF998 domain-containing protein [unclassified Microbacterium]|uniref:DUF998 domain-containing protein n=1 Tax=unclassified Microbacterium TaxID=2609290 RepID=UPI0012FD7104|nr:MULTISPECIES: DUF998 domain-containing protein [unclassified Microbacterium]